MKTENYGYYSKVLKQPFDTLEELRAAEEKVKALEKAKDEKKEDAKKVNDAYLNYIEVGKKANEMLAEARKNYETLKDEFIKKLKVYHASYTSPDGKESYEVTEVFSSNMIDTANDFVTLVDKFLRN